MPCPVGEGGYCKHVAAVLLAWCHRSEQFRPLDDLDDGLERRTKAELVALVKQMLRREPDLELLLDVPLPVPGRTKQPADPAGYRCQAAAAFDSGGDEWGAASEVADELSAILEIGDGFREQNRFPNALAVYRGVLEELLERYQGFRDDEGDLEGVVDECVTGLGACLDAMADRPKRRAEILELLFRSYQLDLGMGGVGLADPALELLIEHTTPEERRTLAGWIREEISGAGQTWQGQSLGALLLDLEADILSDEEFLRICRDTGRLDDLVDRLLALGRVEEAITAARGAPDYELVQLAGLFEEHGQAAAAETLIKERSRTSEDSRVLGWLKQRYRERGELVPALELAEKEFRRWATQQGYEEIRDLARGLGRWETLRPALLDLLRSLPYGVPLLVRIHLAEGEIDQALDLVGPGQPHRGMQIEVAQAVEQTRPAEALQLYRQQAERLIDQRGRDSYRQAAAYLLKMRALYRQLDQEKAWTAYIAGLRERHRSLRALREELDDAGL